MYVDLRDERLLEVDALRSALLDHRSVAHSVGDVFAPVQPVEWRVGVRAEHDQCGPCGLQAV